jgi:hypothetical protein
VVFHGFGGLTAFCLCPDLWGIGEETNSTIISPFAR